MNPDIEVTTLAYDAAGRNTSKQLHNGTTAEMVYDAVGHQVQLINWDAAASIISSFDYEFNHVGRRLTATDESGGFTNWAYDRAGQLTDDSFPSGTGPSWARLTLSQWSGLSVDNWAALPVDAVPEYGYQYVYDPAGNRLTRTDPDSGAVVTNTYDNANRLLTSEDVNGTTTYTYDANGNQLTIEEPTGDVTTNTWDGENRLIQVEHPDFSITTYAYNADGLKVEQDDGVETTRFLYDGNNLLQETDDIGTVEAEFTYVPLPYAHLVSQQRESASIFHHFDGIHDTRQLSDSAGVITDEYSHDAWGQLKSAMGSTPNSHTFKGELLAYYRDPHAGPESSIYSLHHRDYVAEQGRWRSEDPVEDDVTGPYRYVRNDPVNRVDPSGLAELEYTSPDKFGRMFVWFNGEILGISNVKTHEITRTIKSGGTSRNYTVKSVVFSRFVNQVADEAELEDWTSEDWDNWFRRHDLSINPAASDYSETVSPPPRPKPRRTSIAPTKPARRTGVKGEMDTLGLPENNTGTYGVLTPGDRRVNNYSKMNAHEAFKIGQGFYELGGLATSIVPGPSGAGGFIDDGARFADDAARLGGRGAGRIVGQGRAGNRAVTMAEGSPAWAGSLVRRYADRVPPIEGFTDVFIHGTRDSKAFSVIHNGQEVVLSHRQIAGWLKSQGIKGNIRLISCYSGSSPTGSVAQNLANKLGVTVRAPTNAITVHANGTLTAPAGTRWRNVTPGVR